MSNQNSKTAPCAAAQPPGPRLDFGPLICSCCYAPIPDDAPRSVAGDDTCWCEDCYETAMHPGERPKPTVPNPYGGLGLAVDLAVADGILACERRSAEGYKEAKRKLLAWCDTNGVSEARRTLAVSLFQGRVALFETRECL